MFNRIKYLLKGLKLLVREPTWLEKMKTEKEMRLYIIKQYGFEKRLPTIDLLDLFPQFQEIINPYSCLEGAAQPTDLALLKGLAKKFKHCRYLEIGTWRGESVANVADVAEECVSIDLPEKEMKQDGFSDEFISCCRFYSKHLTNVKHIYHNSHTLDFSTLGKFDLIFVDDGHDSSEVESDTKKVFKVLRDDHSIIVWHDYGFTPEKIRWSVLAGILDGCPSQKEIQNIYHVSNTLCAIYTNQKFETKMTTFPTLPNKNFNIKLSASHIEGSIFKSQNL